jgi:hypothetical protein
MAKKYGTLDEVLTYILRDKDRTIEAKDEATERLEADMVKLKARLYDLEHQND